MVIGFRVTRVGHLRVLANVSFMAAQLDLDGVAVHDHKENINASFTRMKAGTIDGRVVMTLWPLGGLRSGDQKPQNNETCAVVHGRAVP